MRPSNRKFILPIVLLGIVLGVVLLLISFTKEEKVTTGAQFYVSPTDSVISIAGQKVEVNSKGIAALAPGEYQATFSRPEFESQSQTIVVKANEITEVLTLLETNTEVGRNLLKSENELQSRESITYRLSQRKAEAVATANPIVSLLPVFNSDFRIDYGAPGSDNKVTVFVTTDVVSQRAKALDWIRSKGYDPATMNIQYRFYSDL